ncbi:MAG: alpha/beta hydrolase [Bacteroidetes bacterium]|nr:MAG: alpha/beta hydrolase [Bacteroidota bacterium]
MRHLSRRGFIKLTSTAIILYPFGNQLFANGAGVSVNTYTYKKVGDLEIKVVVHRRDDNVIRPVVVRIHGGALIMGHREWENDTLCLKLLEEGYAIVSVDYRLAPETKLPAIIEDLEDVFDWIREEGPELFLVDTGKIAVTGGSAGGYLTLTSGFRVEPRPTVMVAFFGYGDLIGDWYSTPSKHHPSEISEKEAWEQVSGPPISDSRDRKGKGGAFYMYCRKHGLWPKAVSGWDPFTEADKFYPYMPVKNVTRDYPPTMLIHGTNDTDVPYEQSVMMAEEFKKHNVGHELVTIPGAEHGLRDGDPELVEAANNSAVEFINRFMK